MATQITNKATLSYWSGGVNHSVESNTAVIKMEGPISIQKYVLENSYRADSTLVYTIIVHNTSNIALEELVVSDNLATYKRIETEDLTPLTYIGPSDYYIDHVSMGSITPTVNDHSIDFAIGTLPAGSRVLINYKVKVNQYAPLSTDFTLLNIASAIAKGITPAVETSLQIPVEEYSDVTITKTMEPNPILDGSIITYHFMIQNYGNVDATSVVLTDDFTQIPENISVKVGAAQTEEYSMTGRLFTYPREGSAELFIIPAADITQDPLSGVVRVLPGSIEVTITGKI